MAGGIGWPRDPKEKPGFAVVVAVDKITNEKPSIRCLEEAENPRIEGLLEKCVNLQMKYGHKECPDLFRIWYSADPERTDTFVNLFNQKSPKDSGRVYPVGAHDSERENAFERYASQVWRWLTVDSVTGKKELYLGPCNNLRNYIQNTPSDATAKGSVRDYPALAALGGVVHTLMMLRPWLKFVESERTVPTIKDPLARLEDDHEKAYFEIYGDQDEDDTGDLVRTCRL